MFIYFLARPLALPRRAVALLGGEATTGSGSVSSVPSSPVAEISSSTALTSEALKYRNISELGYEKNTYMEIWEKPVKVTLCVIEKTT